MRADRLNTPPLDNERKPAYQLVSANALWGARNYPFKDTFTAWLVVQNIEWAAHDLSGSFAYQKHFNWECGLDYAVDTTQPIAGAGSNRCSPASKPAIIGAVGNGKGSNPVLTAPVYNTTVAATTTAVP